MIVFWDARLDFVGSAVVLVEFAAGDERGGIESGEDVGGLQLWVRSYCLDSCCSYSLLLVIFLELPSSSIVESKHSSAVLNVRLCDLFCPRGISTLSGTLTDS